MHPEYSKMFDSWLLCNDSLEGEEKIKKGGAKYLPPKSSHRLDGYPQAGAVGTEAYNAYLSRAVYPGYFKKAVEKAVGKMFRQEPVIELPKALEPMRNNATLLNESLTDLLRKINVSQLKTGRLGLLGDIKVDVGGVRPIIAVYDELSVINWDDTAATENDADLRLVVLDESGPVMDDDFTWTHKERFRVLALADEYGMPSALGKYATAITDKNDFKGLAFETPVYMGDKLDSIPFTFVNASDLSTNTDSPPFLALAQLCIAIYKAEADYRHSLHMQGQDTLVKVGSLDDEEQPQRVGAGAVINVPVNGDAKYIGVSSNGLSEQRESLENDHKKAEAMSGNISEQGNQRSSGESLKIRIEAITASYTQIAKTGAAALEKVLKDLAQWMGANPDEVKVIPNLKFAEVEFNSKTLVELVQAKSLDAPISNESIHSYLQKQGVTDKGYDEELALIESESPSLFGGLDNEDG